MNVLTASYPPGRIARTLTPAEAQTADRGSALACESSAVGGHAIGGDLT
jgi:hypothetical protein